MSESSNPTEGRAPAANRSYGDASTVTRSAAPAAPISALPPTDPAPAPAEPPAPTASLAGARQLGGAAFARVGSVLSGVTGQQGQRSAPAVTRPGPSQARVRKARLRLARLDPWSVMKVSFVLSIAMGVVTVVGTAVVWNVLNTLGVFSSLNKTVGDLTSSGTGTANSGGFSVASFLSFSHVEGYIMIISLVDVVLVTALATLGAYLYNLAAGFVGGFEVTLAEDQ